MRILLLLLGMSTMTSLSAQQGGADELEYFPQQLTASRLLYYCAGSALTNSGRERVKTCGLHQRRGGGCAPAGGTQAVDGAVRNLCSERDLLVPVRGDLPSLFRQEDG